jgi:hypothetical protein
MYEICWSNKKKELELHLFVGVSDYGEYITKPGLEFAVKETMLNVLLLW